MRALLLRTWLTNIGNGFIDSGARALLENSSHQIEVVELSGYPYYAGDLKASFTLQKKLGLSFGDHKRSDHPRRTNMTNLSEYFDVDFAVLPGCVLYEHAFRKYLPALEQLRDNDIPIMLLGAGGGDYSEATQTYVRELLYDLGVEVLLTRDREAYECYRDSVGFSYDGIDCAFFIDEWYRPPEADRSFEVRTFDKIAEPAIENTNSVVRATHTPFEYPFEFPIRKQLGNFGATDPFDRDNLFISDKVEDYLTLYANSTRTHSDRIHACIPTLVYGNEAQFHYETPRANLFERILDKDITSKPVTLSRDTLEKEREEQVDAVVDAINYITK